ncbi:2-dehydro-3-deoxygalactonokinase [Microvirga sp. CF3016]|uniref:2-dehydro-3-deoxygalactonokinase n=1 Tax=Microvirga sp. CF3016 TaxID=3110181 RepID=UPI002E77CC88|nr:2-dehydro-3-deoxygalactonokinase [Microvirga sp. CF3016]MEE1612484.1 2-dehydro-3-deoxygalactonokinase [Microvirga sp. CF3016]
MFLAIEWTSATFHAFLLAEGGMLLNQRQEARGINHIANRAFETTLREIVGDWAAEAHRIYLSGMITSRNGWIETPYVPAPASLPDIMAGAFVKHIEGLPPLFFLPGVSVRTPLPDMMRGEELKIFGAMGSSSGLVALPGAHTKWAFVNHGRIEHFTTYMSGEITALLQSNSLVSKLIPEQSADSPEAFLRGARLARDRSIGGHILRRIFSARSLALLDELPPENISDYLSGLMIGAEINEVIDEFGLPHRQVTLIGPPALCQRYSLALREAGITSAMANDVSVRAFRALCLDHA